MRFWASSGFSISCILSYPTCANHCLNGSALGDEIDWIILNIFLVLAQSVSLNLPSSAINFNCPIFSDTSKPSSTNLVLRSDQYFLALAVSVNTPITSTTENHHSSLNQILLILLPWKTTNAGLSPAIMARKPFHLKKLMTRCPVAFGWCRNSLGENGRITRSF